MKAAFKKAICLMTAISVIIFNHYTFSGLSNTSSTIFSALAATDQTENEDNGNNNFNFIKSTDNVKDFIYDGSLLLYGGIFLIVVSCGGIIITFLPRRRKKTKSKKSRSDKHIEK